MEGDRLCPEEPLEGLGEDVLAGMLLHVVEAAVPVHAAGHLRAGWLPLHQVDYLAVPIDHAGNRRTAEGAQICGLAAALRVEGRALQHHLGHLSGRCHPDHPGGELPQVAIPVVESLRAARHRSLSSPFLARDT